ncbi:hypothetical protein L6164_003138 [Bauhinia variegata]|uniref:Uncharacterized protein n=1 Tax=Bauhinia variegata TaxID=167791 RepID=A0ACB9Q2Q7_BAUVA|nr:hypothetical protein L6164_003138 [Bauhinia variegata]
MEVVSTIVDKLLEYTLIPVTRQVGYVISYKDNVSELKKQAMRLLHERESLQHRVDVAQRNVEEIEAMVNDWLCEVKKNASMAKILLDEDDKRHKRNAEEIEGHDLKWPSDIASRAEELLDEDDKRSKTAWCSSKSFSSMCWRHQISRKAKKLAQEIANIKGEKEFTQVSYRGELNITETWSSSANNDEAFESRVAALNQIMEALADPNLRLIGVHGLGGVGKTTMVCEVAKKVKKSPDTNVVFVDVKQNPKIEKIQQDIADMLGLELKQQSLVVRATLLRQRIDRRRSWELFKVKVALNETSESEELLTKAREVVAECGGLPIAIVTIAAALKGKEEIAEWRDVLRRLQNHDYDEINRPIVVSYENLKDDCLRSIFMLAGVINSSTTIDLFKYCCGLGLFYDMDNLDVRISELKDSCLLQDNNSFKSHFSMHDVVRDTAISIASKDDQFFLKKIGNADEDEWITDDKLKSCRKMLLDFSNVRELPEGLQCSNLAFFYLSSKDSSLKLPHNFFKGMPKLKVLVLINMTFEFLPSLISLLRNLHTLCVEECVLENIEGIGELKGLKILGLSGSKFTNLPLEIGKLTKLQLLDLSRCVQLESIPPGVLLNLQMLEVLLMGNSFSKWAVSDQQSTASLAEIKDLRNLNTLAVHVPDQNMLPKEQLFESLHLQRYEVCIGDPWRGESKTSRFLNLDLHTGIDTKHYFKSLLDHVEDLHVSGLAGLKNVVPNINEKGLIELKHLVVNGNSELQFVADLVEHKDVIFPNLESLDVGCSSNLVRICNGSITERSFFILKSLFSLSLPTCLPHLNVIQVHRCGDLEGIVSDAGQVAGPLQFAELRTLTLESLPSLIGFYSEDETSSKVQQKKTQVGDDNILDPPVVLFSHKVLIPNLETLNIRCDGISKLLPFNVLENLEELEVRYCDSLEVIFDLEGTRKEETHDVVKSSHLRKLTLYGLPKLKHVWNKDPKKILRFQFLSTIEASDCDSLKYLFPASVAKALAKLHFLSITNCRALETIVGREEEGADVPINFVFARVTKLNLQWLPKLMSFYSEDEISSEVQQKKTQVGDDNILDPPVVLFFHKVLIPNLETLNIRCDGISKLLPFNVLENLEELEVRYCDSLEVIFDLEGTRKEETHDVVKSSHLRKLTLYGLPKLKHVWNKDPKKILRFQFLSTIEASDCDSLKYLFPASVAKALAKLHFLSITNCRALETIVGREEEGADVPINFVFARVTKLNLQWLPKLMSFYSEDEISSEVQQKKTQVGDDNILDPPVVLFFHKVFIPNLETLTIKCADKLNKLWDQQFDRLSFHNLKTLSLRFCHGISKLLPFNVLENLEKLEVSCCNSLEVIFDLEGTRKEETHDVVKSSQLRKLTLYGLPKLKHVWNKDPKKIVGFQFLSTIEASDCDSLKYLFPASVAKALTELHFLSIRNCDELETIVGRDEEGADVPINFVFARVTEFLLERLPTLMSFYPGTYSTEWPLLQNLYCKFLGRSWNIFGSGLLGFEEFHCQNGSEVSTQLSHAIQKSIPMLRELKLD